MDDTHPQALTEELRLVLEATKASKMRGGYSTGKRINMRAIIPCVSTRVVFVRVHDCRILVVTH